MLIPLAQLEAHPLNANRVPEAVMAKLVRHIASSGRYPPLIVRRHPPLADAEGDDGCEAQSETTSAGRAERYQIIDGHHRAEALRRLNHTEANCEVWEVSDAEAALLLATLNRLHGEDDPHRRGALLAEISRAMAIDPAQLAELLPDGAERIERLLALTGPPPAPAPPPPAPHMPQAVTFFLHEAQRAALFQKLRPLARDRSAALILLLELGP